MSKFKTKTWKGICGDCGENYVKVERWNGYMENEFYEQVLIVTNVTYKLSPMTPYTCKPF